MLKTKHNLKNRFPFRLGTTSYIIPDDMLPNIRYIGPFIDDVELVLFESDDISNLPDKAAVKELKSLKERCNLSYTVHLPLDIELGSLDPITRKRSVEKCFKIIDLCSALDPFAYIVHFHGHRRGKVPSDHIRLWRKALAASARELAERTRSPEMLCVETLDYPFDLISDIVIDAGMSVCLDVGHLAFYQYNVEKYFKTYWDRCRVIHLHGNIDGKDHRDIRHLDAAVMASLVAQLSKQNNRERVLTLEIFSQADLSESLKVMERYLK